MLVLYRKATGRKVRKLSKADASALAERLELLARVKRPSLVAFFLSGEFNSLPALSTRCIDNRGHRLMEHRNDGWVIPDDSLGRSGTADRAQAQSIILWIKGNLSDVVDPDSVSIVVQ